MIPLLRPNCTFSDYNCSFRYLVLYRQTQVLSFSAETAPFGALLSMAFYIPQDHTGMIQKKVVCNYVQYRWLRMTTVKPLFYCTDLLTFAEAQPCCASLQCIQGLAGSKDAPNEALFWLWVPVLGCSIHVYAPHFMEKYSRAA